MKIDFYYDFISPFSYLAAGKVADLQQATGADVEWIPVNLPKLIQLSGNTPPSTIPNKARYLVRDLKRQSAKLDLPLKLIRPGTFDSRPALCIACGLSAEQGAHFARSVFSSLWSGEIDPQQDDWLDAIFTRHELPKQWLQAGDEKAQLALKANTQGAFAAGGFGVPSFVLRHNGRRELFFGLDHMLDLQEACMGLASSA